MNLTESTLKKYAHLSFAEIGRKFKVSREYVRQLFLKYGIKSQSPRVVLQQKIADLPKLIPTDQINKLGKEFGVSYQHLYSTLRSSGREIACGTELLMRDGKRYCSICETTKAIDSFVKNKTYACGYGHICRECNNKRALFYYRKRRRGEEGKDFVPRGSKYDGDKIFQSL